MAVSADASRVYSGGLQIGGDGYLFAIDAQSGQQLWSHATSLGAISDLATAGEVLYASTDPWSAGTNSLLALDAQTGALRWTTTETDDSGWRLNDAVKSTFVRADGSSVYLARSARDANGEDADFVVEGRDASDGALQWRARYDGGRDIVAGFAADRQATRLFVTGLSGSSSSEREYDYATIALNPVTGERLWTAMTHVANDHPRGITVSPDGTRVAVTGYSYGVSENRNFLTVVLDAATGEELWRVSYDSGGDIWDSARVVAFSGDGDTLIVSGSSSISFLTVAYDTATGTERWSARTPGDWNPTPYAIGTSVDGRRVFIAGIASLRATTVAFDIATGMQDWLATYPSRSVSSAYDLTVGSNGQVHVTGEGYLDEREFSDMITLSYDG